MPVTLAIQLIGQVGLPLALKLIDLWKRGGDLTDADIADIRKLADIPADAFKIGVVA